MRVLVTGSSGKLGSVTVKHLADFGYMVTGLDISGSSTTNLIADVKDKGKILEIIQNFDAVIHTAALHGRHMDLNYSREEFVDTNIKGTLNLLNACVANGIGKFLFTSTTSIYGKSLVDDNEAVWVNEELPIQPRDIYDITKQSCEELCREFFEKEKLDVTVFRVGRFLPEPDNLKLNHRLYRGLDEQDGADALRLALEHNFEQFEIFNISSGSPFQKEDLIELKHDAACVIAKYYPEVIELYERNHWTLPESIDRVYRSDKAMQMLSYQPKFTFEYLLKEQIKALS
ncbi:NAD-dependent epimerase/dehydratase family protein [Pedobacter petrophilus]|uniref:NAD-dependent epimerase/dehydratase family protein n=1 Tax=Pedobacter petrophilus TaxID=1908241 RepID=A0A7K0FUM9_9SPHI|nr:NAD(P)-dependent oxidoreductase [Pedobacter petrophilus]MRX74456.1 NAD-dependent epimerase/dehydratase family protein [Pedobacter petrophilus]